MAEETSEVDPNGPRLGEGEFPPEFDRVNFGAFLLAFLWAPFHRLWGWFAAFAALEGLESVMGLSSPTFLGGALERPAVMAVFRIVYWSVTVVFALRANRLVWEAHRARAARVSGGSAPKPPTLISKYASNERIWAIVGIVLLAATPLSLLVGSIRSVPGAVGDVVVTAGTQAVLLAALFVYDRVRIARPRARG